LELAQKSQDILSVSALSQVIKQTVEQHFGRIQVRGEISGGKLHTSGHFYCALKDQNAVMDAVCWRGVVGRLPFKPVDGMEVICHGKITTYAPRSKYQLVIERMEPAGEGALLKLLEERKRKLAAEGLFAAERKQLIPSFPRVIGVVTSPTGAVIRDILHRLSDRFPCHVLLWPVLVQGEGAAREIASAIQGFNAIDGKGEIPKPDVLIVGRGGGSLEDLWAFNEEEVIRAAADSDIPLVSAVGHETDTTLIDYASDLRAPTPTAAAELAVPVRAELRALVNDCESRLRTGLVRLVEENTRRSDETSDRLVNAIRMMLVNKAHIAKGIIGQLRHPRELVNYKEQMLEGIAGRLALGMNRIMSDKQQQFSARGQLLESYSYHKTLQRGFSIVKDCSGALISSIGQTQTGEHIQVTLSDGSLGACVETIEK